jgi:dihydroorotase
MNSIKISNANIVNEGRIFQSDVWIEDGFIKEIGFISRKADKNIDATGKYLLPGAIDDQVHFREPGLTHKGNIYSEAKAAVAGGVTSYMEMPNTNPTSTTIENLEQKYTRAAEVSLANYSFFMGTTNDNLDEIKKVDFTNVCGLKIFMGSSTGNMLVDNSSTLEAIFKEVKSIIALHCEDDVLIKENLDKIKSSGVELTPAMHPVIRNAEACYASSSKAVALAKKHNTRLHILHISTAKELSLFDNSIPLEQKRITSEACIHHLWFSDKDYESKGNYIKWNPAVKSENDRDEIFKAVLDGRIDVIATDHAPHTIEEKEKDYLSAPSGGPLVQHSVLAMLEFVKQGKITIEKVVQKMSHNVAILFDIEKRGYIREGYYADLVLVDLNAQTLVDKDSLLYHCKWSPFEGFTFSSKITDTFVSGHHVYSNGQFDESIKGKRLKFGAKNRV